MPNFDFYTVELVFNTNKHLEKGYTWRGSFTTFDEAYRNLRLTVIELLSWLGNDNIEFECTELNTTNPDAIAEIANKTSAYAVIKNFHTNYINGLNLSTWVVSVRF